MATVSPVMTQIPPSPSTEFDTATTVETSDAPGTYDTTIDAGWTVGSKPNGGYLLALMGRAATDTVKAAGADHPHPLATTAHFVSAPNPGPARVETSLLRSGRSASQVRAALIQDGRLCVDAVFTCGRLPAPAEDPGSWWTGPQPFAVADHSVCPRLPSAPKGADFTVPILDRAEVRLDPAVLGFAVGRPSGRGELRGWIDFADGRPADPLGLLFFLDALPPATFELAPTGWVPTLSLSAYVRAWPAPGPLRIRQAVHSVHHDRIDETCELWDSRGQLVAQATQLAAIRLPADAVPPQPAEVQA